MQPVNQAVRNFLQSLGCLLEGALQLEGRRAETTEMYRLLRTMMASLNQLLVNHPQLVVPASPSCPSSAETVMMANTSCPPADLPPVPSSTDYKQHILDQGCSSLVLPCESRSYGVSCSHLEQTFGESFSWMADDESVSRESTESSKRSDGSVFPSEDAAASVRITARLWGRLELKQSSFLRPYRRFWCGLTRGYLFLYCRKNDPKPKMRVPLIGYTVRRCPNVKNKHRMMALELVKEGEEPVQFLAEDCLDSGRWIDAIDQEIKLTVERRSLRHRKRSFNCERSMPAGFMTLPASMRRTPRRSLSNQEVNIGSPSWTTPSLEDNDTRQMAACRRSAQSDEGEPYRYENFPGVVPAAQNRFSRSYELSSFDAGRREERTPKRKAGGNTPHPVRMSERRHEVTPSPLADETEENRFEYVNVPGGYGMIRSSDQVILRNEPSMSVYSFRPDDYVRYADEEHYQIPRIHPQPLTTRRSNVVLREMNLQAQPGPQQQEQVEQTEDQTETELSVNVRDVIRRLNQVYSNNEFPRPRHLQIFNVGENPPPSVTTPDVNGDNEQDTYHNDSEPLNPDTADQPPPPAASRPNRVAADGFSFPPPPSAVCHWPSNSSSVYDRQEGGYSRFHAGPTQHQPDPHRQQQHRDTFLSQYTDDGDSSERPYEVI